jgi:hypothetical protein
VIWVVLSDKSFVSVTMSTSWFQVPTVIGDVNDDLVPKWALVAAVANVRSLETSVQAPVLAEDSDEVVQQRRYFCRFRKT